MFTIILRNSNTTAVNRALTVPSSYLGKLEFGQATVHSGMPRPQILPTHTVGYKSMLRFYHIAEVITIMPAVNKSGGTGAN